MWNQKKNPGLHGNVQGGSAVGASNRMPATVTLQCLSEIIWRQVVMTLWCLWCAGHWTAKLHISKPSKPPATFWSKFRFKFFHSWTWPSKSGIWFDFHATWWIPYSKHKWFIKCQMSNQPTFRWNPSSFYAICHQFLPTNAFGNCNAHEPVSDQECTLQNKFTTTWSLFIAPKFWCVDREGCRREIHGRHFNVCIAKCSVHEIRTKFEYIHMTCSACIWENYYPLRISHETV